MEEKKTGHGRGEVFASPLDARESKVEGLSGLFWASRDPDTNELVFHVELRNATSPMRDNFDDCIKFVSAVLWWIADYEGVFAPLDEEREREDLLCELSVDDLL